MRLLTKASLCESTWLTDGPCYSLLSQFCHPQTVSVVSYFQIQVENAILHLTYLNLKSIIQCNFLLASL